MSGKRTKDEIVHTPSLSKTWPWQVVEIIEQGGTKSARHIALFETKEKAEQHIRKREIIRNEKATRE